MPKRKMLILSAKSSFWTDPLKLRCSLNIIYCTTLCTNCAAVDKALLGFVQWLVLYTRTFLQKKDISPLNDQNKSPTLSDFQEQQSE